jgi:predicted DNA-binding protein
MSEQELDSIRVMMPTEMKRRLQLICVQRGYNMSAIVRLAIEEIIDRETGQLPPLPKQKKEKA